MSLITWWYACICPSTSHYHSLKPHHFDLCYSYLYFTSLKVGKFKQHMCWTIYFFMEMEYKSWQIFCPSNSMLEPENLFTMALLFVNIFVGQWYVNSQQPGCIYNYFGCQTLFLSTRFSYSCNTSLTAGSKNRLVFFMDGIF